MFSSIVFGENTARYLQANGVANARDALKVKICLLNRGIDVLINNEGFHNDTDNFIRLTDRISGYVYTYSVLPTDRRKVELHAIPCDKKGGFEPGEYGKFYIGMFNCFELGISRNNLPRMTDEELEKLERKDNDGGINLIDNE